jgi:2,4-dienoyl-CoA reductase-like NADH-dependent reductase (Old Yellow Enzyme family)
VEHLSRYNVVLLFQVSYYLSADANVVHCLAHTGMRMPDPVPQYTHLVTALRAAHPNLAYLHVIEPRVAAGMDVEHSSTESNDFLRDIWKGKPLISAGGYNRNNAMKASDETGDLIAFGRHYIANVGFLPLFSTGQMELTVLYSLISWRD